MALPTDIVDYILSFHQSDPLSLKKCCQSHPIRSTIAERYLYVNVTILDDHCDVVPTENCLREHELSKILSNNPHITNYVRGLKVNFKYYLEKHSLTTDYLGKISIILPLFSSLRKVTIIDVNAHWRTFPQKVHLPFIHHLRLPSVAEMHIENLVLDSSLLHYGQTVSCLTLSQCALDSSDARTPDHSLYPRLLNSFSIVHCDSRFLNNILPWVQSLPLRSLKLQRLGDSVYNTFHSIFPQLLAGCSSSLTSLDLDFGCRVRTGYKFTTTSQERGPRVIPLVDLSLPCLERLTFHARMDLHQIHPVQVTPESSHTWNLSAPLATMLQLVRSSPALQELFLDFQYCFWGCRCAPNILPNADCVWFPLLCLAPECLSLSVEKIWVFVKGNVYGDRSYPSSRLFTSVVDCQCLMQHVERGIVVIRGDVSCGST